MVYFPCILYNKGVDIVVMGWVWTLIILLSIVAAVITGNANGLSAATAEGAQAGIELAVSLAGSMILWCGIGNMMEAAGITALLSKLLSPLLHFLFPSTRKDKTLSNYLSANICANFLGLGNAATPMGLLACKRLTDPNRPTIANDEQCRLVVLNTASIQLIPASVAAIRVGLGCRTPFDILPAVWITSIVAAAFGLIAAFITGKLWKHG